MSVSLAIIKFEKWGEAMMYFHFISPKEINSSHGLAYLDKETNSSKPFLEPEI